MPGDFGLAWNFSVNSRTFLCCGTGNAGVGFEEVAGDGNGGHGSLRQGIEQLLTLSGQVRRQKTPSSPGPRMPPLHPDCSGHQHGQLLRWPGKFGLGADPALLVLKLVADFRQWLALFWPQARIKSWHRSSQYASSSSSHG